MAKVTFSKEEILTLANNTKIASEAFILGNTGINMEYEFNSFLAGMSGGFQICRIFMTQILSEGFDKNQTIDEIISNFERFGTIEEECAAPSTRS